MNAESRRAAASQSDEVRCVLAAGAVLGESPVWSEQEQALYWIDMGRWNGADPTPSVPPSLDAPGAASINRFDPLTGATRRWGLPESIGCFALKAGGGALLAQVDGLFEMDFASGHRQRVAGVDSDRRVFRFNDGKCDRQGRFWVGQVQARNSGELAGALFRYDGRSLEPQLQGIGAANGLAWSPDSRQMYFADVMKWAVWVFDFDPERGVASRQRLFAQFPVGVVPDGAAVDEEGGYWIALYGTGKIARYRPDGSLDREVLLPVSQPTMLAFGGPKLDTLYITSAAQRLSEDQLAKQPAAGGIFAFEPGVRGLPEPLFRGSAAS